MLNNDEPFDSIKGIFGVLLTSIPQFIHDLPIIFKSLAGLGGLVLIILSIKNKSLEIKNRKLENERLKNEFNDSNSYKNNKP